MRYGGLPAAGYRSNLVLTGDLASCLTQRLSQVWDCCSQYEAHGLSSWVNHRHSIPSVLIQPLGFLFPGPMRL